MWSQSKKIIGILVFVIVFVLFDNFIDNIDNIASLKVSRIVENLVTAIGIIVAGIWSYQLFVRKREDKPKLDPNLSVESIKVTDEKVLLNVKVMLTNVGNVKVKSDKAYLRLFLLSPLPEDYKKIINDFIDPIDDDKHVYEGEFVNERSYNLTNKKFYMEPRENHILAGDFFVPSSYEVVKITFFVRNEKIISSEVGWTNYVIHKINKEELTMSEKNKKDKKEEQRREDRRPLDDSLKRHQEEDKKPEQKPSQRKRESDNDSSDE